MRQQRVGRKAVPALVSALWLASASASAEDMESRPQEESREKPSRIEEVVVTGARPQSEFTGPRSYVSKLELDAIQVNTAEDIVAYEPSLIVRRRFIGDPNGTLGIRGSNQFQTARSMVFADGLPLHYLLETSFSGAPRWSLASPDEVSGVEVLYGPFSAEFGGNSMGGVVLIRTELPTERRFHLEATGFTQDYDPDDFGLAGSQEDYGGRSLHASYGDRAGNLSWYLSHDHLNNQSQPLTYRSSTLKSVADPSAALPVAGAQLEQDASGEDVIYFGDTGAEEVTTNLTKLKLGYTAGDWLIRSTFAYEDRKREVEGPQNFLRDAAGNAVFGKDLRFGDAVFDVPASAFEIGFQDRETLLVGASLEGPVGSSRLGDDWKLELAASRFEILKDDSRRSAGDIGNVDARTGERFDGSGRLTRYDDTGWVTADLKLRTERFAGRDDMRLVTGLHYDQYELELQDFATTSFRDATGRRVRSLSGGKTQTQAAFAQWGWQFTERWDLELGLRYERWRSSDGFFDRRQGGPATRPEDVEQEDRSETAVSPKLSIGYAPNETWSFRYSIARATRFPIVAELFSNVQGFNDAAVANPGLQPEEGLHHNLSITRALSNGELQVHLYRETIRDVIFNQSQEVLFTGGSRRTVRTFLPIDEEVVNGVELVANLRGLLGGKVDLRGNVAYTHAEITKNDIDPATEGKVFPRQPKWRGNLLVTYNWTARFRTSAGFRYASDSFDELDNSDRKDRVFGAQDAYRFVNLKATYALSETANVSFGIDNVTNETAYVFHPWPARSMFVEIGLTF